MAPGVRHSGSQALHSTAPPSVLPDISPTRGEIGRPGGFRQLQTLQIEAVSVELPISPRVGEMSGRTEGGVKGWASVALLPPGPRPCVILATPRFRSGHFKELGSGARQSHLTK